MAHLLLTGIPGIGKTTIIRYAVEGLRDLKPTGFYTEEIRMYGIRQGFRIVTLEARAHVLAHQEHRGPHRVGRYGVDVDGFERVLSELNLLHSPASLIIIDEIGKMECLSTKFVRELKMLLESQKMVLATVALRGGTFTDEIKRRPDCRVIAVTMENRGELPQVVIREVRDTIGRRRTGGDHGDE
jgi:nucleoside-triphosphatase